MSAARRPMSYGVPSLKKHVPYLMSGVPSTQSEPLLNAAYRLQSPGTLARCPLHISTSPSPSTSNVTTPRAGVSRESTKARSLGTSQFESSDHAGEASWYVNVYAGRVVVPASVSYPASVTLERSERTPLSPVEYERSYVRMGTRFSFTYILSMR